MMSSPKLKLKVLKKLKTILNGKCSTYVESCPNTISYNLGIGSDQFWSCYNCDEMFEGFPASLIKHKLKCPCQKYSGSEIPVLRVDEYIEELEEKCFSFRNFFKWVTQIYSKM